MHFALVFADIASAFNHVNLSCMPMHKTSFMSRLHLVWLEALYVSCLFVHVSIHACVANIINTNVFKVTLRQHAVARHCAKLKLYKNNGLYRGYV